MTTRRRTTATAHHVAVVVVGVLLALPLALAVVVGTAAPAQATTYRYWTYWWGANPGKAAQSWTFAQVGPAGHRVNDTWVLGWRFATSTTTTGSATPRESPDFATLCPSLPSPVVDHDRVALVVDYGATADAPPGQKPPSTSTARVECLTLPSTPQHETGVQALAAAGVTVRGENGLICGLDGYPVGECAPAIADPVATTRAPTPTTTTARASSARPTSSSPTSDPKPSASSGPASASSVVAAATTTAPPSASAPSGPGTTPAASESVLAAAAGAPADAQPSTGSPVGLLVGGAVVALVAGSAWATSRRRGPG